MDKGWWELHLDEVNQMFKGVRYSTNPLPPVFMTTNLSMEVFPAYGNSGAGCITLAVQGGAARVILLGYDCQHTDGKAHWHGNHPRSLANAKGIENWPAKFAEQAAAFADVDIINCSRQTALTCYPRADLGDALDGLLAKQPRPQAHRPAGGDISRGRTRRTAPKGMSRQGL